MKSGSLRMTPGRPKVAVGCGTGSGTTCTPGWPSRPTGGSGGGGWLETGVKAVPSSFCSTGAVMSPATAIFTP